MNSHSISISMSELYWHSLSLQVRLFATQSHYADRLAEAVSNINCPSFLSISVLHLCISIGSLPSFRGLTVGLGSKALHNSVVYTCNLHHTGKIWKSVHQSIKVLDRSSQYAAGEDCSIGRYWHLKLAPALQLQLKSGISMGLTKCNACKIELITIYSSWHCLGYLLLN